MTGRLRIQPWALLVLVAVAGGAEAPAPSQETSVDECVDESSRGYMKYICNEGEYDIEIQHSISTATIACQDTKLNCSRFPSIDLGRNSTFEVLIVTGCALDEPISCFFAKLNVADVEGLYLDNLLTPLTARHFEGLRATTEFHIGERGYPSVQKTIPYEAIASLPHLKTVRIVGAQLTLTPGLLQAPLLKELWLMSDAISEVPPGFFKGLPSLDLLRLWNNAIVDISNDTFAGLDKLRDLNLGGNRISELRGGALSPLRRLETLHIEDNPLTRLHDGFLQGLDQLQEIEITSSEPLVLGPRAFADLKSLLYLILQDSRIQELNDTVFQGSKLIQKVSLKQNQLEHLHPEVFRDQTELNTLDLSNNRLANIPQDLFKTLLKLENLDLSHNQLECLDFALLSALSSLRTLSLAYNKLGKVSTMGLQGVLRRTPQLPYNRLSFTPEEKTEEYYGTIYCTKYGVRRLQIPDKSVDDLCETRSLLTSQEARSQLAGHEFGEYPVVGEYVTVDLRNNNISTVFLDSMLFPLQNTQLHFILDYNTLNCDCQTHFFAKLAASSNHSQSIESSRCNVPAWLEGAGLTQVTLDNSVCQVKCPSVCNCTDFSSNRIVEAVCSEVSTEPSRLMDNVSLKFTREPRSLRHLSFKNVVKIDLSGLHLNKVDFETLPETVEILNLSRNNLHYLPKYVFGKDIRLTLSDNPLFCDCWNQQHVAELQQNNASILDYLELRCKDGTLLSQVNIQRICDVWILSATGVSLMVFGVLYAVIIYKYSFEVKIYISKYMPWLLPKEKYDASKKYDVFISYAHQDEDFVRDTLLPKLEGPPISLKTCIHSRDWLAGEMITYNIAKSVEESRRTVIVLSENFLKSMWGLLEFRTAHVQATKERRTRVVVILLEDVTNREEMDKEMKAYLRTNTYIKWGESWFWEKLAYALPKRGKVVDKREEKRLQAIANKLVKTRLDVQLNNEDS